MNTVGLVYLFLVAIAYGVCFRVDRSKATRSLRESARSLAKLLPLLVAIFTLIGLFQVFVSPALIERQLGAASGWMALFTGGLLGAVSIGPPLAAFPLAGSLLDAGAWPPAVAAFIVSWVSVGVLTLPFESEVFGVRYALARNGLSFVAAILIGLLVGMLA